ncbi:hypothetical protein ACO0K9_21405 [Undibacterium sp. Ji50W]|uniref:hypothetical protein n=1 Tax=Undibacterium sp. Ji50W TaxID=3413041 RepID=UPI003BF3FE5A
MPNDHHDSRTQQIPFQAYLLAPMFAPLTWLFVGVAICLYGRGLSLAAFGMKFMFMLLLLPGSYALCIPLLHIWASLVHRHQMSKYAGVLFATIPALALGVLYAQPGFQYARHSTQSLAYLAYMLLTCLGMFISLINLSPSKDRNTYPACLAWMCRQASIWGLFSLFKGILALVIICSAIYANSLALNINFSHLFSVQDKQEIFLDEAFLASVFDVNPGHFLDGCFYSGIILAVAAMASALQAKIRGEDTLYRATGCICGALALAVFDPKLGAYAVFAYGISSYAIDIRARK